MAVVMHCVPLRAAVSSFGAKSSELSVQGNKELCSRSDYENSFGITVHAVVMRTSNVVFQAT